MPPDPPRVEGPWGLWQIYPPVTLKYPLMQKLIETPGVDHLNVSWHGMIFSYNHSAQPSIRAQLKTSWNIASNVTKMADTGILLAMVVGILCKKRRKRWIEKVSYGNMGMVTKKMGKRYIQTVYSSSNMKSEPQNHANNYLCLLTHINFKNLH